MHTYKLNSQLAFFEKSGVFDQFFKIIRTILALKATFNFPRHLRGTYLQAESGRIALRLNNLVSKIDVFCQKWSYELFWDKTTIFQLKVF